MNLDRVYLLTPNANEISAGLRLYPIEWQTITLISHNALISGTQLAVKLQITPAGTEVVLSRLLELNIIREPEMTIEEYEAHLAQFAQAASGDEVILEEDEFEAEIVEEPVAEVQPEPQPDVEPVTEVQPEPQPPVEPVAEAQPEPQPNVEPVVEVQPEPQPPVEPVAEAQPEPQPPVEPVAEAQPEPQPNVEPIVEAQPEPQPAVEPVAEAKPETQPSVEPVAETLKPETAPPPPDDKNNPPPPSDSTTKTGVFSRLFGSKSKGNTGPIPVVKPKTGSVKLNYPILPIIDFVQTQSGGGLSGSLAVYRMFLNVPQQLLEYSAWTLIDLESSPARTDNRNLALAFIQAAEKVVGSPVPGSLRI